MKTTLRLEETALLLAAIYFLRMQDMDLPGWLWAVLFFAPDISMLGYLVNNKIGAFSYNFFHHRGVALVCVAAGYYFASEILIITGGLLFAHASFDRIFGYGLKYITGFKDTHLGSLEKKKVTSESAA